MSTIAFCRRAPAKFLWLTLTFLLVEIAASAAPAEAHYDVLRTRTGDYTNVTVTTTKDSFICITHSRGMGSVRVTDLPPEVQRELGYKVEIPGEKAANASAWAQRTMAAVNLPEVKQLEASVGMRSAEEFARLMASPLLLVVVLGISFCLYLGMCYCSMLICKKTGNEPGILVWLPIVQLFPLLRAANMSPVWFLAFLLPVFNIVAHIVWCVKIAAARGKSGLTAFFLWLPFTSLFAFLYLAFSSGKPPEVERGPEIMTLQTA